jgi:hypothetical protein
MNAPAVVCCLQRTLASTVANVGGVQSVYGRLVSYKQLFIVKNTIQD